MATPSATRTALMNEVKTDLSNWNVSLSQSQLNAFVAHLEGVINTNSATVLADVTADLAIWPEPTKGRHS